MYAPNTSRVFPLNILVSQLLQILTPNCIVEVPVRQTSTFLPSVRKQKPTSQCSLQRLSTHPTIRMQYSFNSALFYLPNTRKVTREEDIFSDDVELR